MKKKKPVLKVVAIVLAVLITIIIVTGFTVCKLLLNEMFCRTDSPDFTISTTYSADEIDIEKRAVEFKSKKNTLRGYVWGSVDNEKLIVISHGLGGLSNDYYPEMKYFVSHGYRILTYDNTGTATSDGKGTTGLSQSTVDLHNALSFVENDAELKNLPVYLFGHSWGGHAVTAVLNYNHKNIKAVASVAGYNSNGGIMLEWMKGEMGLGGFAYLIFPYAAICAIADANGAYYKTAVKGINKTDIPVLAVQGGADETVWEDSIYNHRSEIKNKNFEYFFIENGTHNGVLEPDDTETVEYRNTKQSEYDELIKLYGIVPTDAKKEFFKNLDIDKYNGVNHHTIEKVYEFFEKA